MSILSYNLNAVFTKVIKKVISKKEEEIKLERTGTTYNYINVVSRLDKDINEYARKVLVDFLEEIDESYKKSRVRKSIYHIKAYHNRSIMTVFGEVTFKRTFYTDKFNEGSYCHLDRLLGLNKYDYFDPYIKSQMIHYACDNSFAKAGIIISDMIGNRVSLKEKYRLVSRQTVRNTILRSNLAKVPTEPKEETPETIFIMFDEKFISTQGNKRKDVMMKHAVVFESIEKQGKRTKLIGKQCFAAKIGLHNKVLDYLNDKYDTEKIKQVYVLGDGAGWIKAQVVHYYFGNNTVMYGLDKYHFKQALRHLTQDITYQNLLLDYLLNGKKRDFNIVCDALVELSPHRDGVINDKRRYLLNNMKAIQLSYNQNLKCCMEGQISHNIAALFSSRPKGYSIKMIERLVEYRMRSRNNNIIKETYIYNFLSRNEIEYKRPEYDWSVLNPHEGRNYNISRVAQISLSRKSYY